jgi:hypothetical protein
MDFFAENTAELEESEAGSLNASFHHLFDKRLLKMFGWLKSFGEVPGEHFEFSAANL